MSSDAETGDSLVVIDQINRTTGEIVEYLPPLMQQAVWLVESKYLPDHIRTPQQAFAIMQYGKELGLAPMQALNQIYVVKGRPAASTQVMMALLQRSGILEEFSVEVNDERAVCTMKRKGQAPHTEIFTLEDAKKQGLLRLDQWQRMPQIMMKNRSMSACARVVGPDVLLGLYTTDEMGETMADGETRVREQVYRQGGNGQAAFNNWQPEPPPEPVDATAAMGAFEQMLKNDDENH